MDTMPTTKQVTDVLKIIQAIGEAIKSAGENGIPSDVLYAMVSNVLTLDNYQTLIARLMRAGVVKEIANVLYWVE